MFLYAHKLFIYYLNITSYIFEDNNLPRVLMLNKKSFVSKMNSSLLEQQKMVLQNGFGKY